MTVAAADLLQLWTRMVLIREFEAGVQALYEKGLVHGSTHLCDGQEAVAVGFAASLRPSDYSTYTYRGHGHALARGMSPEAAFAEILGRDTGVNRGKGGSMHLTDARLGLMGSFAIVGAGLPVAVGLARAAQMSGTGQVSVSFFGDGASNIGAFHESLNLAAVWKAPVVFVCENNLYGEYSHISLTTPVSDISERASSYAMRSVVVDGNDVVAVRESASKVVDDVRSGVGPVLVECKTYRQRGHSRSDAGKYRPNDEVEWWLARDPLQITKGQMLSEGAATDSELASIESEIREEVRGAALRAEAASWPSPQSLITDVYA